MGWFNRNKSIEIIEKAFTPVDAAKYFEAIGAKGSLSWDSKNYSKDFKEVPEVNAVISLKARAFSSMKLQVVSKETGKQVNNNEPLVKVLRNPNYYQSQKEFLYQTKVFQEVYGNEFIYPLAPSGLSTNYKGLFSLPPDLVEIEYPSRQPAFYLSEDFIAGIKYKATFGTSTKTFVPKELIHINSINITQREDSWLNGVSPLAALQGPIANIRASYEARNVLIERRGALGILSNGSVDVTGGAVPIDPKEKTELQSQLRRYGLTKDQYQFIITNLNLKWQQMAIDADKLQLHEETRESLTRICDVYGVPFELMGNQKGVTFDNKKQAIRSLYQETIIPEAQEWVDTLNSFFGTEGKSWHIVATFDHLPIFAENIKERAASIATITTALSKAYQDGAITIAQYQAELAKLNVGI
jgi:HK97 family phage portal protein